MNPYTLLAKEAVENYIKDYNPPTTSSRLRRAPKKIISPPENLPEEFLKKKSGIFVTIEKEGQLRGCIGTYLPTKENIAEEIISNAVSAATEDYRFGPIQKKELPYLSYTVYILNKPELVKNSKPFASLAVIARQLSNELDPKKYGIIIKTAPISFPNGTDVMFNGHTPPKSGLLLPDLEGVDTIEQQLSIACQKGRIDPRIEKIIVYKFTVEKYGQ